MYNFVGMRKQQERQRELVVRSVMVTVWDCGQGVGDERHMLAPPVALLEAAGGNAWWWGRSWRGGVTTRRSRHICGRTQGRICDWLYKVKFISDKWLTLMCVHYRLFLQLKCGGFTLISGLCCCRYQIAALQPHPPELNAFHTWDKDKEGSS